MLQGKWNTKIVAHIDHLAFQINTPQSVRRRWVRLSLKSDKCPFRKLSHTERICVVCERNVCVCCVYNKYFCLIDESNKNKRHIKKREKDWYGWIGIVCFQFFCYSKSKAFQSLFGSFYSNCCYFRESMLLCRKWWMQIKALQHCCHFLVLFRLERRMLLMPENLNEKVNL